METRSRAAQKRASDSAAKEAPPKRARASRAREPQQEPEPQQEVPKAQPQRKGRNARRNTGAGPSSAPQDVAVDPSQPGPSGIRNHSEVGQQTAAAGAQAAAGTAAAGTSGQREPLAPQIEHPAQALQTVEGQGPSSEPTDNTRMSGRQRSGPDSGGIDDKDPGGDPFGRSASALQGLLRKLGAGFEESLLMGGLSGGRWKSIITSLRQDDEGSQLSALTELCELLSISTEDSLASFPVETVVPLLIQSLNMEHNPDIMLLAARALTFMADVLPTSCAAIVRHGAVPAFCQRLLTIEYIDLAEQSLQALEKLSHEHSKSLLQNGGLLAVLSYLDFFPTGVQRVATATAANMCRGLTPDNSSVVEDAVPILTGLLHCGDHKVVDNACVSLSYIAEAFSSSPESLALLSSGGLITQALQLISVSETGSMTAQLSLTTYYGLVKLLSTCASGSATVAQTVLEAGCLDLLCRLIMNSSLLSSAAGSTAVLRSADQLYQVLSLACELLPGLPDYAEAIVQELSGASRDSKAGAKSSEPCSRSSYFAENQVFMKRLCVELLPLLLQVFSATVMAQVRHKCLFTMVKILYFSTPAMLEESLKDVAISSFIATLLSQRDNITVAYAMQMSEILMERLPDIFNTQFLKEGVVHGIEQLAAGASAAAGPAGAEPADAKGRRSSSRLKEALGKEGAAGSKTSPSGPGSGSGAAKAAPAADAGGAAKPAPPPSLKLALASRAATFKNTYFKSSGSKAVLETEGLQQLRKLCQQLHKDASAQQQLFDLITSSSSNISVFELLSSGAVNQLTDHLVGQDLPEPAKQAQLLDRLDSFAKSMLPPSSGSQPPLLALVRKLQSALASVESFPVVCSRHVTSSSMRGGSLSRSASGSSSFAAPSNLSSGLVALTQPFKLRLCRYPSDRRLKEYSANIVLIEPLATMNAIEDFLYPRVYRPPGANLSDSGAAPAAGQASAPATASPSEAAKPSAAAAVGSTAGDTGSKPAAGTAPAAAAAAGVPPASKAQPIPGDRRMTRAQAAKARAEAQARAEQATQRPASARGEDHMDEDDQDDLMLSDHEEDHDDDMEEGGEEDNHHDDHEHDGMFDEDDDDYEEELDGEEPDIDIGNMHVHDLHVDEAAAAASGAAAATAAAAAVAAAANTMSDTHASRKRDAGGTSTAAAAATAAAAPRHTSAADDVGTSGRGAAAADAQAGAARSGSTAWGGRGAGSQAGGAGSSGTGIPASVTAAEGPKLVFYMGSEKLAVGTTVFQAIQQSQFKASAPIEQEESEDYEGGQGQPGKRLWDMVHTLHYRAADSVEEEERAGPSSGDGSVAPLGKAAGDAAAGGTTTPLQEVINTSLPAEMSSNPSTKEVLHLLQVVEVVNRLAPRLVSSQAEVSAARDATNGQASSSCSVESSCAALGRVSREDFISSKLGSKLAQQLKDVLSICGGSMPSWCKQLVFSCKFLFPFEIRRRYFYCTAFGLGRALQHMQQLNAAEAGGAPAADRDGRELRIGRLQRQKVRVSRKRILESAIKVMELYAKNRAVLELEYFGEVGTGLGPTLEFYTLLSHDMQKRSLGMWRHEDNAQPDAMDVDKPTSSPEGTVKPAQGDKPAAAMHMHVEAWHDNSEFVNAPWGLFPTPLPPSQRASSSKVMDYFKLLGRAMGKALQDNRLMDLPLSYVFYRVAIGGHVDLYDVSRFDPQLGATLGKLQTGVQQRKAQGGKGSVMVDTCPVEDLCLTFTLPGNPEYMLKVGGADIYVDSTNVEEYVEAVVDATVGSGIAMQMQAFREGFNEVFPLQALECFFEDEIETLLCGSGERWTVQSLVDSIKFDHGYTSSSPVVRNFLEILSDLDVTDQRRFLRFVTGCPRLPPGGISALTPRLTVVRKHPSGEKSTTPGSTPVGSFKEGINGTTLADGDLPSVMTCANYIKLPPYSCKDTMYKRLLFAIREGQGSFDLS